MEKKNLSGTELETLETSLRELGIQDLEERLEVSSLAAGGDGIVMGQDFFDISFENCCNGGKCSGNTVPEVMDIIDTNEM